MDGISETAAVLKAVFEPQGARVERRRSCEPVRLDRVPPHVVVVDLDDHHADDLPPTAWPEVPHVVLSSTPGHAAHDPRFLEKPFHYPELVRLVQSLLDLPTDRRRVG